MPEVYTKERVDFYIHKKSDSKAGENNAFSKLTDNLVLEIRKYYSKHTFAET